MALGKRPEQIVEEAEHVLLAKASNWKRVQLSEVAKVQNGFAFSSSRFTKDEGMPLIRIRDIDSEVTENRYNGNFESEYVVRKGDILVGMDGDFNVARWKGTEGLLNQRVCRIILKSSYYDEQFLFLCLQPYLDAINAETSSVTVKHLSSRTVEELPLPLPPLPEQHRIVEKIEALFSELDKGVEQLKTAAQQLKVYRQSVLKWAFEGRLTEQWRNQKSEVEGRIPARKETSNAEPKSARIAAEPAVPYTPSSAAELLARIKQEREALARRSSESVGGQAKATGKRLKPIAPLTEKELAELPSLPEGWAWGTLEELAANEPNSITDGPFGSNLKTSHYTNEGPRVVRLQNIGNGQFIDEDAHISREHFEKLKKHQIHSGDIVIASLGSDPPRSCIIPKSLGLAIVKADCIRFKTHPQVNSKWINFVINSEPTKKWGADIVHGVGRPRLNLRNIRTIRVPVPSRPEQDYIVQEIESRLSVCDKLEETITASLQQAEALRQSILKRAFEGKLVPQCPDDEPAEKLLERIKREREATEKSVSRIKRNSPPRSPSLTKRGGRG